jgi:hypothetical protein
VALHWIVCADENGAQLLLSWEIDGKEDPLSDPQTPAVYHYSDAIF